MAIGYVISVRHEPTDTKVFTGSLDELYLHHLELELPIDVMKLINVLISGVTLFDDCVDFEEHILSFAVGTNRENVNVSTDRRFDGLD